MEPPSKKRRIDDCSALNPLPPRQTLIDSLKIFAEELNTPLDPFCSFWARYEIESGKLIGLYSFDFWSLFLGEGGDAGPFETRGVFVCYRFFPKMYAVSFFIPSGEDSDFCLNVKAFELALKWLVVPNKEGKIVGDLVTKSAIDKLIRSKPYDLPTGMKTPDPLHLLLKRARSC